MEPIIKKTLEKPQKELENYCNTTHNFFDIFPRDEYDFNGKPYTHFYAHLLNYAVKVGDKVNTETVIGHVGGGKKSTWDRCSTGAHLHFGISNGFYLGGGSGSYYSYNTFVAKSVQPPGFPKKGSWFYVR